MKFIALLILGLVVFIITLVGAAAFTGNLNKAAIDRLLKRDEAKPATTTTDEDDPQGALALALKKRADDIESREAALRKSEERVALAEQDLEAMRTEVEQLVTQIEESVTEVDLERQQRLMDVASTVAEMKPVKAAEALRVYTPSEAAAILRNVKEKDRGKILDAMEALEAAPILRALEEASS